MLAGLGLIAHMTSCGTILHPERRGQPAGRLDPAIVCLDAAGLILFFVPGVIAFAVDFSNGTIYLPSVQTAHAPPEPAGPDLQTVRLSPAELTPQRLEAVVQERTGRAIHLEPGAYRARRLNNIDAMSTVMLEDLQSRTAADEVRFRESDKR